MRRDVDDGTVHIDLDLDLQDGELRGRVEREGRPSRRFWGWLGLLAALDELIDPSAGPRPREG